METELPYYHRNMKAFIKAYNHKDDARLIRYFSSWNNDYKQIFLDLIQDVANKKLVGCHYTEFAQFRVKHLFNQKFPNYNMHFLLADDNFAPQDYSVKQYSRYLSFGNSSEKKKFQKIEQESTPHGKLSVVVTRRHSLLFARSSILSRGGRKLVQMSVENQTIDTLNRWVEDYLEFLSLRLHKREKINAITIALFSANESLGQNDEFSSSPESFHTFLNDSGLAKAIQKTRLTGEVAKGWSDLLSTFTGYAEYLKTAAYEMAPQV